MSWGGGSVWWSMTPLTAILLSLTTAHANGSWGTDARDVVPNDLSYELGLERLDIDPEDASALYGVREFSSAMDAEALQVDAVGWIRLDGLSLVNPRKTMGYGKRAVCASLKGHDPVAGGRQVVTLAGRDVQPAEQDGPPTLVLASDRDEEFALVRLAPGDELSITDVSFKGKTRERIELTRGNQRLTVDRRGKGATVCYEPNIHARPEWLPD